MKIIRDLLKTTLTLCFFIVCILALGGFLSLAGSGGEKASLFQTLSFFWVVLMTLIVMFINIYKSFTKRV